MAVPARVFVDLAALSIFAVACTQPAASVSPGQAVARHHAALSPPLDNTADLWLGQSAPTTTGPNLTSGIGLNAPESVAIDRSISPPRLWVADAANHRVLGWDNAQAWADGAPADRVLGQADVLGTACNRGLTAPSTTSLCTPTGVAVDAAGNLYVADNANHRVLFFTSPATTDVVADRVFGQLGFGSGQCNLGASVASADSLCNPAGVALESSGALYVTDAGNYRVLRYANPASSTTATTVLGQADFVARGLNRVDGRGMSFAVRVALDTSVSPNRVYVADLNNHRVLGWPNATTFASGDAATLVLGQENYALTLCNRGGTPGDDTLCSPRGLWVDGAGTLFVADSSNNRVLAYLSPFTTDGVADKVWGQAGFTTNTCNLGGLSATSLCAPFGVGGVAGGDLLVADTSNNRVLRYFGGGGGDTTADVVFGQPSFLTSVANNGGLGAATLWGPRGVTMDGAGNIFIADGNNNRVLQFDPAPADVNADRVFGQLGLFTTNTINAGGLSASSLYLPGSVALDAANNLWVGDETNYRVLGFATPLTTDTVADRLLGKASYTSNCCSTVSASTNGYNAMAPAVDAAGNVYSADHGANRVTVFNTPFTSDNVADRVLGQGLFTTTGVNLVDVDGFSTLSDVAVGGGRVFVTDVGNNRVLGWATTAFSNGQSADRLFGQSASSSNGCAATASGLCGPRGATLDGAGNLLVADTLYNRVLRYDAPYPAGDSIADVVLGQAGLTGSACNLGLASPSGSTLCGPRSLAFDAAGNLYVSDTTNHRVLRYDSVFTSDTIADAALGQTSLSRGGRNFVEAAGMDLPNGVALDRSVTPNRLYVVDTGNHRVLGWPDVNAFSAGEPATVVIGKADAWTGGCNFPSLGTDSLCSPSGLAVDGLGRLYVADRSNNRVLGYDSPFTTDTTADVVLGQVGFTTNTSNQGLANPTAATLSAPFSMVVAPNGDLYVSDRGNHRVLRYIDPRSTDTVADQVFGQPGFATRLANQGGTASATTLNNPDHLALDTSVNPPRLYVADETNCRVLEYDDPPTDAVADLVLGQPSFTSTTCSSGSTRFYGPSGVAVDGLGNVYVLDFYNRVLQFNEPRTTDTTADRVYGQTTFTGTSCNQASAASATTLCTGTNVLGGLAVDPSGSLYAADPTNHRLLIYFANNRPTATPATLTPSPAYTNNVLTAAYTFADADADPESGTQVRWFKDTVLQPALTGLTVSASLTARGQQWHFTVRPRDGQDFGPLATSNTLTIANSLPVASAPTLSPTTPLTDDTLSATYGYSDLDGDPQGPSDIRWYRNASELVASRGQTTLSPTLTTRGDVIYFTVQPHDGVGLGALAQSQPLSIGNTPPVASALTLSPSSPQASSTLVAAYAFADADSDAEVGSQVRWYRNGLLQTAWNDVKQVTPPLSANDTWYYVVTPRDGLAFGAAQTSPTVIVGSTAPTATALSISPTIAYKTSTLSRVYTYTDPDGQPQTGSQTRWFRNGVGIPALDNSATVAPSFLTRGESWVFTITPCDNTPLCGATQTSPSRVISNSLPTASAVVLAPAAPVTTNPLTTSWSYADGDADPQGAPEVRWYRNGIQQTALFGLTTVPAAATAKGESWYFTLRPNDGLGLGSTFTSNTVTVLNSAPSATGLSVTPASPVRTDTLASVWAFGDADNDGSVGTELRWFVNGVEDATLFNNAAVPASKLSRGQVWYFTVRPRDGTAFGALAQSPSVTIQNSPPVATDLTLNPPAPAAGASLSASYTYADADGDTNAGSELRWFKNGVEQVAFFNLATVPGGATARGERWSFSVRPRDGSTFGNTVTSAEVTIANALPSAINLGVSPSLPRTTNALTATFSYADPDGDPESGSEFRWFRNGTEQTALFGLRVVPAGNTSKGQSWYFTMRPRDGVDFGAQVTSPPVTILNSAPTATGLTLSPLSPRTTDPLNGNYSYADADGDAQQGTLVRWYRDGVEELTYAGQLNVPAGVPRAGETWYFTVRPRDGVDYGNTVTSTSVVVGSSAPVASALLVTPLQPRTADTLVCNYLYSDPDNDPEGATQISWFRNGVAEPGLPPNSRSLPPGTAARGETWHFTVRPHDGLTFGATQTSPPVTIGNTAPTVINAAIAPSAPTTTDPLTAVYTYDDDDNDAEGGSELRWYKNGIEQTTLMNSAAIAPSATRKNEVWYYRVRPRDGTDFGSGEVSAPAFIQNTPPVVSAGVDQQIVPRSTVTRVQLDGAATTDADNDVLAFTWTESGVTLASGAAPQVDLGLGRHTLTLTVFDGEASASDVVEIEITEPKPLATAPPAALVWPGHHRLVGSGNDVLSRPLTSSWVQSLGDPSMITDADRPTATAFSLKAGPRTYELTVSAGTTQSAPAAVEITTRNVAPWAFAPARVVARVGTPVAVSGTRSNDPNGDDLAFAWSTTEATLGLAGEDAGVVWLSPTRDGRAELSLIVDDGALASSPTTVEVLVLDPSVTQHRPVAHAGKNATTEVGLTVTLDGRASYDVDGDVLTWRWRKLSGPAGELSRPTSAGPSWKGTAAGEVILGLVVSDGREQSDEATLTLTVIDPAINRRPVARVGTDLVLQVGQEAQLDGTRSGDADADPLTYAWTTVAGPRATLDDDAAAQPTLSALRPGFLRLGLVVHDGRLASEQATLLVRVTSAGNSPPTANAGIDQVIAAGVNSATLDGSGSRDPENDALTYVWEQLQGSPVVLEGGGATPTFVPPGRGRYVFRLTVWDGETVSLGDEVELAIGTHGADNRAPIAHAGVDQTAELGATIALDGSASSDPDPFDKVTSIWTFVGFPTGAEPQLDNPTLDRPTFTPTAAGAYTLRLVVNDGDLDSAPAFVNVLVGVKAQTGCGCTGTDGGALWALLGGAALLLLLRRRTRWAQAAAGGVLVAMLSFSAQAAPPKAGAHKPAPTSKKPRSKPVPQPEAGPDEAEARDVVGPTAGPADARRSDAPLAGPQNPFLEEARAMFSNFQLEGLQTKLEFALGVKGVTESQKVEIFKLMAFTHASFDDGPRAVEAFLKLLELKPKHALTGASPKIRAHFLEAQRVHRERQAVKLQHSPPLASAAGASTRIDVVAVAGGDRVAQMTLHFRPEGVSAGFSQADMVAGDGGAFSGTVPNIFPGKLGLTRIEYFVRARDKSGALLASVGEEDKPFVVEVETVAAEKPFYKTVWFWGAAGAVVVAAATAITLPFVLAKDATVSPGSLGTERLP